MSKPRHTPAPWEAFNLEGKYFPSVYIGQEIKYLDGSGSRRCSIVINDGNSPEATELGISCVTMETCQANAHLIAASPDMYAALQAWIQWVDSDDTLLTTERENEMIEAMRLALAKAKGVKPSPELREETK